MQQASSSLTTIFLLLALLLAGCITNAPTIESTIDESQSETPALTNSTLNPVSTKLRDPALVSSHGSALINPNDYHIEEATLQSNGVVVWRAQNITTNTTIPFLEPSHSYTWQIQLENSTILQGTLETPPNPYGNWATKDEAKIHPGSKIPGCTLGFILRDATNESLYGVTAGHCSSVGRESNVTIRNEDGTRDYYVLGETIASVYDDHQDWAFIKINPESRNLVNPEVPYFSGPTRLMPPEQLEQNDVLCWYGNGYPIQVQGIHQQPEEEKPRCGKLGRQETGVGAEPRDNATLRITAPDRSWGGDSGSPLIHYETGAAVSIHVAYSPPMESHSMSLCKALEWMQNTHGETLHLATSTYTQAPTHKHPTQASHYPTDSTNPPS